MVRWRALVLLGALVAGTLVAASPALAEDGGARGTSTAPDEATQTREWSTPSPTTVPPVAPSSGRRPSSSGSQPTPDPTKEGEWSEAANGDKRTSARNLPVSTGSLAVFDGSRSTPARGGVPGHAGRDLPTSLWYPSDPGNYPLVVFAHGYNTTPGAYATLLSFLASAGYVVAAPALPGARNDVPGTPMQSDIPNQPRDLSVVVDAVLNAAGNPASGLFGKVNGDRIGAVGHSDGGVVVGAMALNSATVDPRLRATAVLSGGTWPIPGGTWGGAQAGSVLVAHGNADPIAAYSGGLAVYNAAHGPRAFLTALGGSHQTPYTGFGTQPDAVRASIADFLDAQLRGDLAGVGHLFTDANQPGLTSLSPDGISANPLGTFEAATRAGNQSVRLTGWVIDPDGDGAVAATVLVDGRVAATQPADATRAELPFFFPSFSAQHGLDTYVPVGPGTHTFCVVARNFGNGDGDSFLGCRAVTVFPLVVGGPAVANFDGRLEVFAVQPDGLLRHTYQDYPGLGWDAWWPLGDQHLAGAAQVATNSDGRLEVFGIGPDGQIWHTWQVCAGCSWSPWYSLPGSWRPDHFSVAANGDGRLEIFAIATDGSLQHIFQPAPQSGWSPWYTLNAPWNVSPAVVVPGVAAGRQNDGRLVVVAVDPAGQLVTLTQDGPGIGWGTWKSSGGTMAGTPVLGVNRDLSLEVFAVGANGQVWHATPTGTATWTAVSTLGGSLDAAAGLAVANNMDQRLEVFGSMPSSHAVTHAFQNTAGGPWSGFGPLGGNGTKLAAANNPDGRIELFAMALPVTHTWQVAPNSAWASWYVL